MKKENKKTKIQNIYKINITIKMKMIIITNKIKMKL